MTIISNKIICHRRFDKIDFNNSRLQTYYHNLISDLMMLFFCVSSIHKRTARAVTTLRQMRQMPHVKNLKKKKKMKQKVVFNKGVLGHNRTQSQCIETIQMINGQSLCSCSSS